MPRRFVRRSPKSEYTKVIKEAREYGDCECAIHTKRITSYQFNVQPGSTLDLNINRFNERMTNHESN